jgi:hypothetical protein
MHIRDINMKKQSKKRKLPAGRSDFEKIIRDDYYYVDKTLFIKDILDEYVALITRPRRFGKTMNMEMLRCFFEKSEIPRKELFKNLAISDYPDCM